jgi:hypothetical protein
MYSAGAATPAEAVDRDHLEHGELQPACAIVREAELARFERLRLPRNRAV